MFDTILTDGTVTLNTGIICTAASIVLGLLIAFFYMKKGEAGRSYLITLAILPLLVQAVIMLVNGNLGTAVGVMGAFSLVRFRSLPGNSKEIAGVFLAMAAGVATGMGYIAFAALLTVMACALVMILEAFDFGSGESGEKDLRITIPESIDYTGIFDDLFEKYTGRHSLVSVKTTNMGSMYDLNYRIRLKDPKDEKKFIDELRVRNGNLTIICGRVDTENRM